MLRSIALPQSILQLAENIPSFSSSQPTSTITSDRVKSKKKFPIKTVLQIIAVLVVVLGLSFGVRKLLDAKNTKTLTNQTASADVKTNMDINKDYTFTVKSSENKDVPVKFTVQNAETRDIIIIKGTQATAAKGRTFLLVNLKINNDKDKSVFLNTRDYIRLSVNGSATEWLAPDIHNDPVEVQAISTKLTRVGFAINETDKNLSLQIGEINGKKDTIKLNLK